MKLIKYSILIFFILSSNFVFSQNIFEIIIDEENVILPYDVLQNNNEYIIVGSKQTEEVTGTYLVKLSEIGEVIETKSFFRTDTNSHTHNILLLENGNYLTYSVSNALNDIRNIIELTELNSSFDTIRTSKLYAEAEINYYSQLIQVENDFLVYNPGGNSGFLYKIDSNLDSLIYKTYDNASIYYTDYIGNKKLYSVGYSAEHTPHTDIIKINAEDLSILELFDINNCPPLNNNIFNGIAEERPQVKRISDSTFIFSAEVSNPDYEEDLLYNIMLDTAFNLVSYSTVGESQQNFLAEREAIVTSNDNDIFIASQTFGFNKLSVIKQNSDMEFIWEKFYDTNSFTMFRNIITTSDGGVLIVGDVTYENIIVIKTDANGNITHINGEPSEQEAKEVILYPNPATAELTIQKAVQVGNCTVEFFSITGQKILSQELTNNITKIDISNLEKGSYIYKITTNSKVLDSGKWIKQ